MRTRVVSRQIPPAGIQVVLLKNNTLVDNPVGSNPPSYGKTFTLPFGYVEYDRMWDEENPDPTRKKWKRCEHYSQRFPDYLGGPVWDYTTRFNNSTNKWYKTHLPALFAYNNWRIPPPFGYLGQANSNLPTMYSERTDGGFVPPPAGLENLQNRALSVILPKVKADMSLLNSLIELKDFKKLAVSTLNLLHLFKQQSLIKHGQSLAKFFGDLKWKDVLSGSSVKGASGFLFTQFALLPLISDVIALKRALRSVERRVNDLINREGKRQTRHCSYRVTLPDLFEVDHGEPYTLNRGPFDGDSGSYVHRQTMITSRTVRYDETVFHVEVEFNYNFTSYQRERARMLVLLDMLGWNFNPAIIWNALPFSFLVDWVANLGKWLDQFKVNNMDPKINIIRCLWSIRGARSIQLDARAGANTIPVHVPKTLRTKLPVIREVAYRRQTFQPTISSLEVSGLNSKEFSLGAALVIAQRRHRYRR